MRTCSLAYRFLRYPPDPPRSPWVQSLSIVFHRLVSSSSRLASIRLRLSVSLYSAYDPRRPACLTLHGYDHDLMTTFRVFYGPLNTSLISSSFHPIHLIFNISFLIERLSLSLSSDLCLSNHFVFAVVYSVACILISLPHLRVHLSYPSPIAAVLATQARRTGVDGMA